MWDLHKDFGEPEHRRLLCCHSRALLGALIEAILKTLDMELLSTVCIFWPALCL